MVAACFVILSCMGAGEKPTKCAINANTVSRVRIHPVVGITYVDRQMVKESFQEVVKKFKKECGR